MFSDTDTGFVSGKADQESLIAHNVLGCQYDADAITTCWNGNAQDHYADAGQVVNYAEIHDNMTLYDKLRKSVPTDDEATTERAPSSPIPWSTCPKASRPSSWARSSCAPRAATTTAIRR